MPRGRLAPLVLLLAAACVDRGPPIWAPSPDPGGAATEGCARAARLRARAPALFEEGRIDRTARVLQRAEDLCPVEAPATWGLRVRALAAVGRSAEALQLAARIDRSDRASDADRAAAAAARAVAEAHGRVVVDRGSRRDAPELFDPNEKRRGEATALFRKGSLASRSGDHAGARKLFLDAWEAWHPNPRALVEAGMEASAAGARAEAQALWDRAAYDDATVAVRAEVASSAPPGHLGRPLAWSADGERLAVGGDVEVTVFDRDLHPTLRLRTKEPVFSVAFAPDGSRVLAGLEEGAVRVFDTVTAAERDLGGRDAGEARPAIPGAARDRAPGAIGHRGVVRAVAMSSDLHTVASAGEDGTVRLWDTETGTEKRVLRPARGAILLAFDPTGALLASALEDGRVALWNVQSGALAGTLGARGGAVRAMGFEGASLDVVSAAERVRWDLSRPRQPRPASLGRVKAERASLAVPSAQGVVASLDAAGITVTDLSGKTSLASHAASLNEGVVAFALAPSGGILAAVYRDGTLSLLPAAERREPRTLSPGKPVDALAPAPDGRSVAAATEGRVLVWRADGDRLKAHEPGQVRALAFSPDGRTLAMGLAAPRIDLRDVDGRRPDLVLDTAGAVDCLAYSPDGSRLAAGTAAPSVQIFSAAGPGEARSLSLGAGPVRSARFSPDGTSLLIASHEGLTLWSPAARDGVRFIPYGPETRDAAFTPDGAGMVVANQRGELLFGKPLAKAAAPLQTVQVPTQVLALAVARDGTIATAEGDRAIALRSPVGKGFQRFRDPDAAVRKVAFFGAQVVAGLSDGSVRLHRAPSPEPVAVLRAVPGLGPRQLGGVITGVSGHLEVVGPDAQAARAAVRCRLGAALYPFDVCAEQFVVEGLLSIVLSGKDPAEADP